MRCCAWPLWHVTGVCGRSTVLRAGRNRRRRSRKVKRSVRSPQQCEAWRVSPNTPEQGSGALMACLADAAFLALQAQLTKAKCLFSNPFGIGTCFAFPCGVGTLSERRQCSRTSIRLRRDNRCVVCGCTAPTRGSRRTQAENRSAGSAPKGHGTGGEWHASDDIPAASRQVRAAIHQLSKLQRGEFIKRGGVDSGPHQPCQSVPSTSGRSIASRLPVRRKGESTLALIATVTEDPTRYSVSVVHSCIEPTMPMCRPAR